MGTKKVVVALATDRSVALTEKERTVLESIVRSEYRSGVDDACLREGVWTFDLGQGEVKGVPGVLVSLKKKGLADLDESDGQGVVSLTDDGVRAWRELERLAAPKIPDAVVEQHAEYARAEREAESEDRADRAEARESFE